MAFDPIALVGLLIALVMALTLHEFAHAWMSDYLGDTTARHQGRLTLNPLAHIDPVMTLALPIITYLVSGIAIGAAKPVQFNPWAVRGGRFGAALVALAGPATNLLLVVFFGLWLRFVPTAGFMTEILGMIVVVNAGFFVFNIIPFPPLDGSRVLYAVAPAGLRELMDRIEQAGIGLTLLLFFALYYLGLGNIIALAVQGIVKLIVPELPLP